MRRVRSCLPLALIIAACLLLPHSASASTPIHICEDAGEWPPYTYHQRIDGKPTGEIGGFSVDVAHYIFRNSGFDASIVLLPWTRCLKEVENGGNYQMALNASYSEERAQNYLLSRPYYRTTSHYFFSRRAHPDGLAIQSLADLGKYRVCGLLGYNYETYGLRRGSIDQGARDFPAVIAKLHANRCDLFVEKYEVMSGFAAIGQPLLADRELGHRLLPGAAPTEFHMLVSRNYPNAEKLLRQINDGIAKLKSSGQLDQMHRKYFAQ